jgi:hypothetical protein
VAATTDSKPAAISNITMKRRRSIDISRYGVQYVHDRKFTAETAAVAGCAFPS